MIARKILLAAGAAALMSTPAWAHGPSEHAGTHGQHGTSHKCAPHKVGYVAAGLLSSQTLAADPTGGTFSGDLVIDVKRTNHHARADKGQTVTYTLSGAHVKLDLADTNNDGSVGLDDLAAGDRVHVIGKITTLAKKCDQSNFTSTTTIRRVVIHAPASPAS